MLFFPKIITINMQLKINKKIKNKKNKLGNNRDTIKVE